MKQRYIDDLLAEIWPQDFDCLLQTPEARPQAQGRHRPLARAFGPSAASCPASPAVHLWRPDATEAPPRPRAKKLTKKMRKPPTTSASIGRYSLTFINIHFSGIYVMHFTLSNHLQVAGSKFRKNCNLAQISNPPSEPCVQKHLFSV